MAVRKLANLFGQLGELERQELLRAANIPDQRPDLMIYGYGHLSDDENWLENNRSKIAPLILRWVDPPDDEVAAFVREQGLTAVPPDRPKGPDSLRVRFITPSGERKGGVPLNELAAEAAALSQMMISLLAANRPFGEPGEMPRVSVRPGSVDFNLAGPGLLGFGLMVIAACSAGVITAPFVLPIIAAGTVMTTAGTIESVLNWRKSVAETKKIEEERYKVSKESSMLDLEREKRGLEIEKLRLELQETRQRQSPPASSLVPLDKVRQAAEQANVELSYAHHVLNRALPVYVFLQSKMPGIQVVVDEHPPWRTRR
jgi:hypothetical protein